MFVTELQQQYMCGVIIDFVKWFLCIIYCGIPA